MTIEGIFGILGYGNMGAAILEGLVKTGTLQADRALVFDVDPDKGKKAGALGARCAQSIEELTGNGDVLLLATKPQDVAGALKAMRGAFSTEKSLVISIEAGISVGFIQNALGSATRVIRVMPNTPALVGAGAAAMALSDTCSDTDSAIATSIFGAVGIVEQVPEAAMDAVTGLSGSGPAYFFYMVECMAAAAIREGLGEEQATRLATQTLLGAGRLLAESDESAATVRERVTSKGGTTAAALNSFRESGFEEVVQAAISAAAARSRELGQ
ncbi:MAG TPA: pyrroline-5-carboxylate reductase [Gammaproteobacteria bacterium]|nr:pyrroline-5-carboxylate reductase [Candidatus Hydrogenedentota bacterium]HJP36574.1 pyrroline-5-carboxylate reductase [Gammaproteobacteria bacterium]